MENESSRKNIKTIAFYLPQFHPTPENNKFWGKGFTEWTNVTKARPQFQGHHQPRLPADLGFYDLRLPETRAQQAELAREHGIHGFCYYHYWFNGQRVLERPFQEVFESGEPDFPFCLCWANENWTRKWDGGSDEVLLEQNYSKQDDLDHIRALLPYLADDRYIRVDGKPLFLVYRTSLLPSPQKTAERWREVAMREGIGELFLVRVEAHSGPQDPADIGFDASVDFSPDWGGLGNTITSVRGGEVTERLKMAPEGLLKNEVYMYDYMAKNYMKKEKEGYIRFPCVSPRWDNTARREENATIILGSTPQKYGAWLSESVKKVANDYDTQNQLIFINAWNEWAEGAYLEPDQKWGTAYLDATADVLIHGGEYPPGAIGTLSDSQKKELGTVTRWLSEMILRIDNYETHPYIDLLKDKISQIK